MCGRAFTPLPAHSPQPGSLEADVESLPLALASHQGHVVLQYCWTVECHLCWSLVAHSVGLVDRARARARGSG